MTDKRIHRSVMEIFERPLAPLEKLPEGMETAHPVITAGSIHDMLIRIGLPALNTYIDQGETARQFYQPGATSHFFYCYTCPDSVSSQQDNQDKPGDDDLTRMEKAAAREFEDDITTENFKLDLGNLTNGVELRVRFNENTCLYQLDQARIIQNDKIADIDCGTGNQAAVNHLITEFAAMAHKVMNARDLEIDDFITLWPIYRMNRRSAPGGTGPQTP